MKPNDHAPSNAKPSLGRTGLQAAQPRVINNVLHSVTAVCLACLMSTTGLAAQQRVLRLAPPNAQLSAEFTEIASIRELPDGRILIADSKERRVVVGDFVTDSVADIGRSGQGPEEYTAVSPLFSLGGDSSLMASAYARRWLIFRGATIVRTVSYNAPAIRATAGTVLGADSRGFILSRAPFTRGAVRGAANSTALIGRDSSVLIRVAVTSGAVDTVATVWSGSRRVEARFGSDPSGPESITITRPILRVDDEVRMFPDGWVAIARVQPYRVDWQTPDGRWTRGAPLPFREVPIDDREKATYRKWQDALGRRVPPESIVGWASVVPPFLPPFPSSPLIAAPEGRLLIARPPTAEQFENRYDLVDRAGKLVGVVVLPVNERIVAVGRLGAYVVVTSEFGLETVRRHPWPPQ